MRAVVILGVVALIGAVVLTGIYHHVRTAAPPPASAPADDPPLPPAAGLPPPPATTPSYDQPPAPATNAAPAQAPAPALDEPSPAPTPAPAPASPPPEPAPPAATTTSTPPAGALSNNVAASDTPTAFDRVGLVDASLSDKLEVTRAGSHRNDANLLTVFVGLKNKTDHLLEVDVQTIYKDSSGQLLNGGAGSWIPMVLKPHEEQQYRSVAITEEASDFIIRIRKAVPPTPAAPAGGGP